MSAYAEKLARKHGLSENCLQDVAVSVWVETHAVAAIDEAVEECAKAAVDSRLCGGKEVDLVCCYCLAAQRASESIRAMVSA